MDCILGAHLKQSLQHVCDWLNSLGVEARIKVKKKRAKKGKKYPNGTQPDAERDYQHIKLEWDSQAEFPENLIFKLIVVSTKRHDGVMVKLDPQPKTRFWAYVVTDR